MPFQSIEKFTLITAGIIIFLMFLGFRFLGNVTFDNLPPVVIQTIPASGNDSVEPFIKELRVVFSKKMMTKDMYSIVRINANTFPKISGNIHFLDDSQTCIIPVELESGKTYAFWLNKGQWNSFRDISNNPAIPYLFVFKTMD